MNDLADNGIADLSAPRLSSSVESSPGPGTTPAAVTEHYRDRSGCASIDFATGVGMGHIPDFTWQSNLLRDDQLPARSPCTSLLNRGPITTLGSPGLLRAPARHVPHIAPRRMHPPFNELQNCAHPQRAHIRD
jgi:hypothetical protein